MRTLFMKSLFILFLLFAPFVLNAQVNFEDGFTDGDFTSNPTWSGADSNFVIITENGNNLLRLNDNEAFTSYLSTPSTNVVGEWEFFVRFDGFSPSNSNRTEIYLMSDNADLTAALNGYILKGGENGSGDVFRLIRITGGAEDTEVLAGTTSISSGGDFRVKVTRDASGNWTLEVATGYTGTLAQEGTGTDNTYTSSTHFGVKTIYSASRSTLFAYDFKIDLPPLTITNVNIVDNSTIDLTFSEDVDPASVQATDFVISNGIGSPNTATTPSANTVRLSYSSPIPGNNYELVVNNVNNASGATTIAPNSTFNLSIFDTFASGDIIINEIMKDPPAGLVEYIEIFNRSSKFLNLRDWQIGDDGTLRTISNTDLAIAANSFLTLSSDTTTLRTTFTTGNMVQVSFSSSQFNNSSDQVRLFASGSVLVDSLQYESNWGGVDVALERRNPDPALSIFIENWGDSPAASGGSASQANTIAQDVTAPILSNFTIVNDSTFRLVFSERLNQTAAQTTGNYTITEPAGSGITVPNLNSATFTAPDTVILAYANALTGVNINQFYTLQIANQADIFGNINASIQQNFQILDIFTAGPGDIVINEFMYDPADGFTEFVEIRNTTSNNFDITNWTFNDNTGNRNVISFGSFILPADSFVVLTPDSSLLNLFPGIRLADMGGRFPSLNNAGDDIVIRNADGTLLDSLKYVRAWGGDEVSLERRSPDASLSGFMENWGDSPASALATAGAPNQITQDVTSPALSSFTTVNDSTFKLVFSERLQGAAAQNITNYAVTVPAGSGISVPILNSATFSAPDTVTLAYASAFPQITLDQNYTLGISNQADIFNNVTALINQDFQIIEISTAAPGDVIVNEFMYDPADGLSEFVELRNTTTRNFDLTNWTLNDNSGNRVTITSQTQLLPAQGFAVLVADSTLLDSFPNAPLVLLGNNFPSLNNAGDDIVIRNESGVLLDSVQYVREWGGDEVSLERRDARTSLSSLRENWGDSPSPKLATAGSANQIPADTQPPTVESISIFSNTAIRLRFSERLDAAIAQDPANYMISPALNVNFLSVANNEVIFFFDVPLVNGQEYAITISNQQDIFGNVLPTETQRITFVELSLAARGDIVVNEILYRQADATSPEFVEIFNTTDRNFDLENWTLEDAGGNSATIPGGTVLSSGSYLVLTNLEAFANSLPNGLFLSDFPSLNDSGDAIIIRDENGTVIDSLFYLTSWGGNTPGVSVERRDPQSASNDASNWASSSSQSGSSAGVTNAEFENDVTPPEIIFSNSNSTQILVAFSEFIQLTPATTFSAFGNPTTVASFDTLAANTVLLNLPATIDPNNSQVSITGLTDIRGNVANDVSFAIAQPITPGAIVINEILYDPIADDDDNLPNQTEYIELYNRSTLPVSLEGLVLNDAPNEEGNVNTLTPVSTTFKWIPAGGYVLVYAEDAAERFADSELSEFFNNPPISENFTIRIDRSSLSLSTSDDAIFITDSTGTTIDSVFYDESWQNPNRFDVNGVALERIDPNGPSNNDSNWSSSTDVTGGTPGIQNTIFQEPGAAPTGVGISLNPRIFSPNDNDGNTDNLFISYTLDQPDYLLRVRIFDRYGRLVRRLVDGEPAGFQGTLTWDGLTDDNRRNRLGRYIIFFEAFNSAAGRNRTFKQTVVIAAQF